MIDALLKAADIFLGRRDKLREADADRRQRLSLYFENVSRCLWEIAEGLKRNSRPWKPCEELDQYHRQNWLDTYLLIETIFGADLAHEAGSDMWELSSIPGGAVAYLSRRIFEPDIDREADATFAQAVAKIEQAAGKFKALSVLASTSS